MEKRSLITLDYFIHLILLNQYKRIATQEQLDRIKGVIKAFYIQRKGKRFC